MKESIEEEGKINAELKKQENVCITLIIKDGKRFFVPHDQLRDKFHHAKELLLPIPETLANGKLTYLSNPSFHQKKLETFRNKEILPDTYVEQYAQNLRLHVLDPNIKIIEGTLGVNRQVKYGKTPKIEGCHLYNEKTGFNSFFDMNGKRYRTGFKANPKQQNDITINSNIM